ncbi:MAG TPA: hypothetical protein VGN76_02490 [Gemmatimonadales bacterium]|jgi:hypothetical protein|nr:hypothetical protein [Gemmatimonadales bacterium]
MQLIIPWYVAPIVLGMVVALAFWLYRLVARAIEAAGLPPVMGVRVRRITGFALGSWLLLALVVARSAPLVDAAGNGVVPISIPFFALVALGAALGLLAFSGTWRRVVDAIPAESLISVQVYRLIGAIFILLYSIGRLPRHFALPAGWGDVAVGLLAPLVALAVRRQIRGARPLALGWNLFGFADLVVAVGLGTGYLLLALQPGLQAPPGAPAMTFFPLVLIPTFAVPLGFILHIYSIRRTLGDRQPVLDAIGEASIAPRRARVASH